MLRKSFTTILAPLLIIISLFPVLVQAAEVTKEQLKGIDEQVQDIKSDVLKLTSELSQLEEKLLYPSNTQVSLFVSYTGVRDFEMDSIQIKIDNKVVAQHLYTFKEFEALRAGGVQRIYTGNIKTGDHLLVVSFIGRVKSGVEYERSDKFTIKKEIGPKFVELQVTGTNAQYQTVTFKDW